MNRRAFLASLAAVAAAPLLPALPPAPVSPSFAALNFAAFPLREHGGGFLVSNYETYLHYNMLLKVDQPRRCGIIRDLHA